MFNSLRKYIKRIREFFSDRKPINIRSSIYGRVVFIIAASLILLFVLFNIVFRSMYTELFNKTIHQNGEHVSSIVEGALYYSMLENDRRMLQRTLDVISTMSGIDEVNMYGDEDYLAFTSVSTEMERRGNPNCTQCHSSLEELFPGNEKSYQIIDNELECGVYASANSRRQLLIRKPIQNAPSCYTAACHAHSAEEEILGSLLINLPLEDLDVFVEKSTNEFMILAALITIFLVSVLIVFTRKRIKKPLNSILKASEAVSNGDHSIRIDIKKDLLDDMRKVSLAFNNMLDNINAATKELQNWSHQLEYKVQKKTEELSEAQKELIHVERIASLGKLSSSVAHEINNPLSGILVYSKLIHKQLDSPEFYHSKKDAILKNLKVIETETRRCGDIVKGLLDFSRKDREGFETCGIHKLLEETYNLMTHSIKIEDISFQIDLRAHSDKILCSPNQIKQACVALLVNASEAIHENGEISIRTFNPNEDTIRLEITDNGSGIAPENLSSIFEPFFSTKQDMSGTGLGLSIVHGIVENHKGKIEVESELGKGTTMAIILPLAEK